MPWASPAFVPMISAGESFFSRHLSSYKANAIMKTSVLLVDDHAVVRQGLVSLLAMTDDFEVIGEAPDGAQAVELARKFAPGLVVIDLTMPGMDSVTAIRALKNVSPCSQIAVLASTDDDELAFSAIEAGAQSFLLKSMSGDALLEALGRLGKGESVIHSSIAHRLLRTVRSVRKPVSNPFARLTERELDVLRVLADGASNVRIARKLNISENTVKSHLGHVLAKLFLADRTEAVAFAWRQGLLSPDTSQN
jgi:two-component system, NarL family, response regulator LiaR